MFVEQLMEMGAYSDAVEWASAGGYKTPEEAWAACDRADWMLWYAERIGVDHKLCILAACDLARTVLHVVPEDVDAPSVAIETTEAWARGEASIDRVRKAAAAASTYADAAYAAANAAANAVRAAPATAVRAAGAAHDAAYAAYAAANAAAYAAYAAANADPDVYAAAAYAYAAARAADRAAHASTVHARIPAELIR